MADHQLLAIIVMCLNFIDVVVDVCLFWHLENTFQRSKSCCKQFIRLLAFLLMVIGTCLFFCEVGSYCKVVQNSWSVEDHAHMSAWCVWLEDIPQLLLNWYLAVHHKDDMKSFESQAVKSGIAAISILVRLIQAVSSGIKNSGEGVAFFGAFIEAVGYMLILSGA